MKVWNYLFIAITMMLVMTFLGFQLGGFTQLFNLLHITYQPDTGTMTNVTLSASSLFSQLFGNNSDINGILLALVGAGGAVVVGLFARVNIENLILLPFITGTIVLFVEAFVSIMNIAIATFPAWASAVILVIFIPFTVGFIVAMAEFFRGSD